jgi:plastocyanin
MHRLALSAIVGVWLGIQPSPPKTHVIQLERNQFNPREIRAHAGDTLRFVNGQGGPHNVMFEKDSIAPDAAKAIDAAIGKQRLYFLAGPILILEKETFTLVVPNLPAGRYPLYCNPHFAQMRGGLIVER